MTIKNSDRRGIDQNAIRGHIRKAQAIVTFNAPLSRPFIIIVRHIKSVQKQKWTN